VELEGTLGKALLKGCLWMGESQENSEGGQDEAGQQPKQKRQKDQIFIAQICLRKFLSDFA
jgi:hypothetical protein